MSPCTRRLSLSFAPAGIYNHAMTSCAIKSVHSKLKPFLLHSAPPITGDIETGHIEVPLEPGHEKGLVSI